jgi:putative thioredoxin
MGYSISINNNFEAEAFQKSFDKPVLIDFYATWCGPCQMLKPILEKIAQEYDVVVAKVNIDDNQSLAHDYGVEGIPDVRLMNQGEIIDRFVGVLPEAELREFLGKHNIKSGLETGLYAIESEIEKGNFEAASTIMESLLKEYKNNQGLILSAAKLYIDSEKLEKAEELLSLISESEKQFYSQAQALKQFIFLERACKNPGDSEIDKLFSQAACLAVEGSYQDALDKFLDIVSEDRSYKNDAARKSILALFELLGEDNPLTKEYRRKLMTALY